MGRELDFDKLKGSENFHTWQFAMKNFLALKGMGNCIEKRPNTPASGSGSTYVAEIVHAADLAIETDGTKLSGAKAYLVLGVDTSIYVHIQKCTTALDVWNSLRKLYEDKGLYRKIALLSSLLSNKLVDCNGMQDYVDRIASAANKLGGISFPVNDEWLGAILLSGLTDDYKPFIMGLEANGCGISGDLIISKLLDSQGSSSDQNSAFIGEEVQRWKRQEKAKVLQL